MITSIFSTIFPIEVWATALALIFGYIIYTALPMHYTYWKNIGLPYLPPSNVKTYWNLLTRALHELDQEACQQYGRIHGRFEGRNPTLNVIEPELLKQIMVKDFQSFVNRRNLFTGDKIVDNMVSLLQDEHWKRVRTILTPVFTTGKIKKMMNIIKGSSKRLSEHLIEAGKDKKPIEIKKSFGKFTMDVIASAAFATNVDAYSEVENLFVANARKVFSAGLNMRIIFFLLFPKIAKLFRVSIFEKNSTNFFVAATLEIIRERKNSKQQHNDFLQLMMDAAADLENKDTNESEVSTNSTEDKGEQGNLDMGHEEDNDKIFKRSSKYKTLSHDELVAQCVAFFLVGYDTTASTMAFASYLLALNPDCQDKLIAEVDSTLEANNGELTYESIQGMTYLDKVMSETLRYFPVAVRIERAASEDYDLGVNNIFLKKGMVVGVPVYAMHHDPEFYPDPEKFDPERFSPEEKERRHPYAFLPFGAGPRNCLGMRFALMEMKVCLAQLLSKIRFTACPETKMPLKFGKGQGLLQPLNLCVGVEQRNAQTVH